MRNRHTLEELKTLNPGMYRQALSQISGGDPGPVNKKNVDLQKAEQVQKSTPEQKKCRSTNKKTPEKAATSKERMQALGRLKSGEMNKTEKEYSEHLESQRIAGFLLWWRFECVNFKLAEKCFLKIDFLILKATGELESHDVKGYWTDDALVKMKVAASIFPWPFLAVTKKKKNGGWEYRNF